MWIPPLELRDPGPPVGYSLCWLTGNEREGGCVDRVVVRDERAGCCL